LAAGFFIAAVPVNAAPQLPRCVRQIRPNHPSPCEIIAIGSEKLIYIKL
jgi:hypothetical protein